VLLHDLPVDRPRKAHSYAWRAIAEAPSVFELMPAAPTCRAGECMRSLGGGLTDISQPPLSHPRLFGGVAPPISILHKEEV
jgi:hypothetical protein